MDNIKKVELDKLNINNNVKLNTMQADANTSAVENLQLCNFIDDLKNFPAYLSLSKKQKKRIEKYSGEVKDIKKNKDGSAEFTIKHDGYQEIVTIRKDGTLKEEETIYEKNCYYTPGKDNLGSLSGEGPHTIKRYDDNENLVNKTIEYRDATFDTAYNDNGDITHETKEYPDGSKYTHGITYNGQKRTYEYYQKTKGGKILSSGETNYDSNGNKIYQVDKENGEITHEYKKYYDEWKKEYVEETYIKDVGTEKKIGSDYSYYDEDGRSITSSKFEERKKEKRSKERGY